MVFLQICVTALLFAYILFSGKIIIKTHNRIGSARKVQIVTLGLTIYKINVIRMDATISNIKKWERLNAVFDSTMIN